MTVLDSDLWMYDDDDWKNCFRVFLLFLLICLFTYDTHSRTHSTPAVFPHNFELENEGKKKSKYNTCELHKTPTPTHTHTQIFRTMELY